MTPHQSSALKKYGEVLVLTGLGVLMLIPLWIVKYPVLLDFPAHLARVAIARGQANPLYHFSAFYHYRWYLHPYLYFDAATYILSFAFDVFTSGKIVISFYVVGLLLATWALIRSLRAPLFPFIVWPVLFTYNWWYVVGSVNYLMGVVFGIFTIALYIKGGNSGSVRYLVTLLIVLCFTIVCHPVACALTIATALPLIISKSVSGRKTKYALLASYFFLAVVFIAIVHALFHQPWDIHENIGRFNWLLHDFNPPIESRVMKLALFGAGLLWLCAKKDFVLHVYLPAFIITIYCLTPSTIGMAGHNEMRVGLFALVLAPLFIPSACPRPLRIVFTTLFAAAGLVWHGFQIQKQVHFQGVYREVEAIGKILPCGPSIRPILYFSGMNVEIATAYITISKGGYFPFIPSSFFHGLTYVKNDSFCPDTSWNEIDSACARRYDYLIRYSKYCVPAIRRSTIIDWGFNPVFKGEYMECFKNAHPASHQ
jgi:hypothetical protein